MENHPAFKPGWRTTEFWLALLSGLADAILTFTDRLPVGWAALLGAATAGIYSLLRHFQKMQAGEIIRESLEQGEPVEAVLETRESACPGCRRHLPVIDPVNPQTPRVDP